MDSGYSGTPLQQKLGYRAGQRVAWIDTPVNYAELLGDLPEDIVVEAQAARGAQLDLVHIFATKRSLLAKQIGQLKDAIARDGMLWVSWPKQSAAKKHGISSDITEETIRDICLPLGLVDNKVCAVDEIWSGLKLVWRKELR